jgi:glucokinase
MILAGDIGGTHTRLALFDPSASPLIPMRLHDYASHDYPGLAEIAVDFLSHCDEKPQSCCFGVSGPVVEGKSHPTNLPWALDAADLKARLGAPTMLINDLEANAYGVAALAPGDLAVLQAGHAAIGNAAVISAGTGLGEAGLFWDGKMHRPFASEGGHCSFSPTTPLEVDLLLHLTKRFGHVSWERVLSGPGVLNIYEFLRDTGRGEEPDWLVERMKGHDRSAAIAHAAIHGESKLCIDTLGLFVSLYGSAAGNLALKLMAIGGVYLGGGIAPRILGLLREGTFLLSFAGKGRMHETLSNIPIFVITNDKASLLGAASCAIIHL